MDDLSTNDILIGVGIMIFIFFVVPMLFGGPRDNSSNTVYIDCSDQATSNSKYCSPDPFLEDNLREESYYQNIVR